MAEISGFHNSISGDRRVKSDFFARFFGSLIGNGVFPNPSSGLQVLANGDMTITVKTGKAWINGVFYENTDNLIFNLDIADGVLHRIDRVVLQYNTLGRSINAKIKKGVYASNPVAPTLQRDADAWELGVADIYITNGAVSISQANITDLRLNNTFCGIVHTLVDQVDTTTIFNQYQAWYNTLTSNAETTLNGYLAGYEDSFGTWFDSIRNILDENAAANLLGLINDNADDIEVHTTSIGKNTSGISNNMRKIRMGGI